MRHSILRLSLIATTLVATGMFAISAFAEDVAVQVEEATLDPIADAPAVEKPKEVEAAAPIKVKAEPKRTDRADAFLAGPDWDFDGFVAGGQGAEIRSMFYLNDLVYLNIGSQQGLGTGDKIGIYKRGMKVNDPETGKFIGYEVRRAAIGRVTDRIEDATSAVRIRSTYEPVEIGDLVRREQ